MSLVNGLAKCMVNLMKMTCVRPFEPIYYILVKLRMVTFKGKHIIRATFDNGAGGVLLTIKRIDSNDTVFNKQRLEQFDSGVRLSQGI